MSGNAFICAAILTFMLHFKGHQLCSKSICLEWRVTDNRLMLFCQIHDIHLSVFIDDPNGNILADCVPPFQSSCEAYYKNGTMNYNVSTNEVKFIVHGKISKQLNGNWTCRHGTNWDRAVALISVIKLNGLEASTVNGISVESKTTGNPSTTCMSPCITDSTSGNTNEEYGQKITPNNGINKTKNDTGLSRSEIYVPLAGGLVLFLSLFVGFNIWISRKCRTVNLKNETEFLRPNIASSAPIASTGTNSPQIESNLSEYEKINENEMIQGLVDLSMLNKTESVSVSSCSRTSESSSASNRSYLEVVDYSFNSNYYETLQCHRDSDTVHLYSTTVELLECKLESSYDEASTCPLYKIPSEIKQEVVTIVHKRQSLSLLPNNANESAASDAGIKSDTEECGDQNTPASLLKTHCLMVPDISKTTNAHSVCSSTSNPDNSNRSIELPSSTNPRNAMSTLL